MFRTIFSHQPFTFLNPLKIKACLLCLLTIVASTPNLHAQQQCSTPYETNCQVTIGPVGCGNGGVFPCWIRYVVTLNDDTPNALIHYTVYCNGNFLTSGQVYSGGQFTITDGYSGGGCYGGNKTGNMYATAPGYTQSNTGYLSF